MPCACVTTVVGWGVLLICYGYKNVVTLREHIVAIYLRSPLSLVVSVIVLVVQINPSYSSTHALNPLTTIVRPRACAVLLAYAAYMYRKLISIPKRDEHTYIATYIQTQNEMGSRISCMPRTKAFRNNV